MLDIVREVCHKQLPCSIGPGVSLPIFETIPVMSLTRNTTLCHTWQFRDKDTEVSAKITMPPKKAIISKEDTIQSESGSNSLPREARLKRGANYREYQEETQPAIVTPSVRIFLTMLTASLTLTHSTWHPCGNTEKCIEYQRHLMQYQHKKTRSKRQDATCVLRRKKN